MMAGFERIAAELRDLAASADDQHPIDPHKVNLCVIKLLAQVEMHRAGLLEPERAE